MDTYSKNEELRDGTQVLVRAITPDDKPLLQNAMGRLSPESIYHRFFYPKRRLTTSELEKITNFSGSEHVALGVAVWHDDGEVTPVGIGRYTVGTSDPTSAEIAFIVADEFQGLGAGTMLLRHLVAIARQNDIERFTATVLKENERMLSIFAKSRLPLQRTESLEVVEVTLVLNSN